MRGKGHLAYRQSLSRFLRRHDPVQVRRVRGKAPPSQPGQTGHPDGMNGSLEEAGPFGKPPFTLTFIPPVQHLPPFTHWGRFAMDFQTAIRSFINKALTVEGRACRSEFWYSALFMFLASLFVQVALGVPLLGIAVGFIGSLVLLALVIPGITVGVRRLHDIDRSGWWLLLHFVPLFGALILLYWAVQPGTQGQNRYGEDPLSTLPPAPPQQTIVG